MKQTRFAALAPAVVYAAAFGGPPAPPPVMFIETLDATSTYSRDNCRGACDCDQPTFTGPATGSFTLVASHQDEWVKYYDVWNVLITVSTAVEGPFTYSGTGAYEIGGDFAYTHRLVLDLVPSNDPGAVHHFDSGYQLVPNGPYVFPAMAISAEGDLMGCTVRSLQLNTSAVSTCAADIGRQDGQAGPDGVLDNNDFIAFITLFFAADPRADRGVQGGTPGVDGEYDNNDFIVFINQFFTPC